MPFLVTLEVRSGILCAGMAPRGGDCGGQPNNSFWAIGALIFIFQTYHAHMRMDLFEKVVKSLE